MAMNVEAEIRDLKRRVSEIEGSFGFLTEQVKTVHKDLLHSRKKPSGNSTKSIGGSTRSTAGSTAWKARSTVWIVKSTQKSTAWRNLSQAS